MRNVLIVLGIVALVAGCDKLGVSGHLSHALGNWSELRLPAGCVAKQIAAEEGSGVAVLCEDGRVFH